MEAEPQQVCTFRHSLAGSIRPLPAKSIANVRLCVCSVKNVVSVKFHIVRDVVLAKSSKLQQTHAKISVMHAMLLNTFCCHTKPTENQVLTTLAPVQTSCMPDDAYTC